MSADLPGIAGLNSKLFTDADRMMVEAWADSGVPADVPGGNYFSAKMAVDKLQRGKSLDVREQRFLKNAVDSYANVLEGLADVSEGDAARGKHGSAMTGRAGEVWNPPAGDKQPATKYWPYGDEYRGFIRRAIENATPDSAERRLLTEHLAGLDTDGRADFMWKSLPPVDLGTGFNSEAMFGGSRNNVDPAASLASSYAANKTGLGAWTCLNQVAQHDTPLGAAMDRVLNSPQVKARDYVALKQQLDGVTRLTGLPVVGEWVSEAIVDLAIRARHSKQQFDADCDMATRAIRNVRA